MAAPITALVDGTNVVEVDPISRIEGHLGVKVQVDGSGNITEADVHGNLWRGFENFLLGREVNDAITFVQRICGVCPVPHGLTSTYAVDSVLGYSQSHITFLDDGTYGVPEKALHIRNLVLASEFLMSSITHFYHLAAPSYVQGPAIPPWTPYFADNYYHSLLRSGGRKAPTNSAGFSTDLWSTVIRSYVTALRVRRLTFDAGALFAGRMPMTSCFVGGGVTFDGTENLADRCTKFKTIMGEIGRFIIREYVPIVLALGALYPTFDSQTGGLGIGGGLGNFLSWGAFPQTDDTLATAGGVVVGGSSVFTVTNKAQVLSQFVAPASANSVPANLTEDIANSRYSIYAGDADFYTGTAAYPGDVSRTEPNRGNGYTYMKAPRWGGDAMEVGPFARLVVAGIYPVDGTTSLASAIDLTPFGLADYMDYTTTVNAVLGLDPKMIAADIAVALVREGAATLQLWDGSAWTIVDNGTAGVDIDTLDNATIVAAYTGVSAFGAPVITDGPAVSLVSYIVGITGGLSTIDRLRARAIESLYLVQKMIGGYNKATDTFGTGWIDELQGAAGGTFIDKDIPVGVKQGWGATEAPRGALMHQITSTNGKITKYQCIVPTTWNGSPKDAAGNRGAIEESMCVPACPLDEFGDSSYVNQAGATVATQSGVEPLRIAQSFDPCIACAVH